jgi:hypothetical protein
MRRDMKRMVILVMLSLCLGRLAAQNPDQRVFLYLATKFNAFKIDNTLTQGPWTDVHTPVMVNLKTRDITLFGRVKQSFHWNKMENSSLSDGTLTTFDCTDENGERLSIKILRCMEDTKVEWSLDIDYTENEYLFQMNSTDPN